MYKGITRFVNNSRLNPIRWDFTKDNVVVAYLQNSWENFKYRESWNVNYFEFQLSVINQLAIKHNVFVEIIVDRVGLTVNIQNSKKENLNFLTASYWIDRHNTIAMNGDDSDSLLLFYDELVTTLEPDLMG